MSGEKPKSNDTPHVSLFPTPPWQLVKRHSTTGSQDSSVRPPTPPATGAYRMFGSLYNVDDAILRSLESQNVRRVYPQVYNRKRELRKINFSILANYLDLLDIITRDPSSPKRTEKLDHIAVLFINMHHLVNEYRQHQARDLLREILNYQVRIAAETVDKAEQYLNHAVDLLKNAGNDLIVSGQPSVPSTSSLSSSCIENVRSGLSELGPDLTPLLQKVLDETLASDPSSSHWTQSTQPQIVADVPLLTGDQHHLDTALWQFLTEDRSLFDGGMDVE